MAKGKKVFRPYLDDVERLSYGKGAKKQRGTGSRFHCHRLNREERTIYEFAKQASFLIVRGTGYRKNRKGSPLWNIFRQRCDALERICIRIEKRPDIDTVVIDFSTLRLRNDDDIVSFIMKDVVQVKYPDLYDVIMKDHHVDAVAAAPAVAKNNGNSTSVSSIIIGKPINWEEVKTKPIWGVNERRITVSCERNIAKALAIDVLRESSTFRMDDNDDFEKSTTSKMLIVEECAEEEKEEEEVMLLTNTAVEDNCIDWNDI